MINNQGARCDGCNETIGFHGSPFNYMIYEIKRRGWKIILRNKVFRHFCPVCVQAGKLENKRSKNVRPYWWQDKDD